MKTGIPRLQVYDFDDWAHEFYSKIVTTIRELVESSDVQVTGPFQPLDPTTWAYVQLSTGNTLIVSSSIYNMALGSWGDCKYIRTVKPSTDNVAVEFDHQAYNKSIKNLLLDAVNNTNK